MYSAYHSLAIRSEFALDAAHRTVFLISFSAVDRKINKPSEFWDFHLFAALFFYISFSTVSVLFCSVFVFSSNEAKTCKKNHLILDIGQISVVFVGLYDNPNYWGKVYCFYFFR